MAMIKKLRKHERGEERQSESAYFLNMWRGRSSLVEIPHPREVNIAARANRPAEQKPTKEKFRQLIEHLCVEHPSINTDSEILGGKPHVKGTRLSVSTVLAKLYLYGSIQTVVDIYEPHLSAEQVKEAIAYAQDFLEKACGANEP
jgi:uncharacterized protein (DUF433 family)